MPYTKQTWVDEPSTTTPIDAARLNHMEDGIYNAQSTADAAEAAVTSTNTVLSGAGAPAAGVGTDGDFYIDTTADAIYGPKTAGAWGAPTALVGPQGPQGPEGPQGIQGPAGADGSDGADGKTVLSGAGAPASGVGVDGDFYIDTTNYDIYGPKSAGVWGAATSLVGPQGPAGSGTGVNTILNGTGAPAAATGADGDFYIDTANELIYGPKTSGAWGTGTSLVGPEGPQGPQGTQGPEGPQGIQGVPGADGKTILSGSGAPAAGLGVDGDFYIDTSAADLYGPKTAGAWGAATSLVGPQGPQGPAGADGSDGAFANGTVTGPITFTDTVTAEQGIVGPIAVTLITSAQSPYTLATTDQLILVDATGGAVVLNVPAASTGDYAWSIWRKADGGANAVTVTPNGTDTVDGATTVAAGAALDVAIDGGTKVYTRSGSGAGGGFSGSYTDLTNVPTEFNPSAHASTHATAGTDPIAPADIGAAPTVHTHDYTTGITGKPSSFTPSAHKTTHATGGTDALAASDIGAAAATHASQHASGGSDPVTPAAIGAAPTTHTHTNAQVADPVPFSAGSTGAAITLTWTAANRLQFATISNAAPAITLSSIPDGGFMEMIFTTSVANPAVSFAISGGGTIVQMSPDILVPANSGSSVSFMVERRGTSYYLYKTGEHAA